MGASTSQDEQVQPPPVPPPPPPPSEEPRNRAVSQDGDIHTRAKEPTKTMTTMTMTTTTTKVKLPHNYEAIVKDADSPLDMSSINHLYEKLHAGVYLNQKRKKYWVEKKTNRNCFMVFARDLSITWAEDSRYWNWPYLKESTSEEFVDVAELVYVCWLEVHGKFEITKLSPGVTYEVVFAVMLKDPCYGWDVPVNLRLTLPDGNKQVHKENLMEKPRGRWIEIPVGEIITSPEKSGEIEFSLYEYEGGKWKKGLVIKGAVIRPKN